MRKLFTFKKLSWKISFVVCLSVFIVGLSLAIYMQTRIIHWEGQYSRGNLIIKTSEMAAVCDMEFSDAIAGTKSVRALGEAVFDPDEYRKDPENYMDGHIRPIMDGFIYSLIDRSDYISAAFFTIHPDLAGFPFVNEIYYYKSGGTILYSDEPETYESYLRPNAGDMEWFFGAYNGRAPYWTQVYEYDGENMVSYVEPVIIGGVTVGVAGVDIPIGDIVTLVSDFQIYDSGFALLQDRSGNFFESGSSARRLSAQDREALAAAGAGIGEEFHITLGGEDYVAMAGRMINGYGIFTLVPAKEFNEEVTASLLRFMIIFPIVLAICIVFSLFIGKSISRPISAVAETIDKLSHGEFMTSELDEFMENPDETGILARAMRKLNARLVNLTDNMNEIAEGDLSGEVTLEFEGDHIGGALNHTLETFNVMFGQVGESADTIKLSSKQISEGAQLLAQGSIEQAQTVEQISASVSGIGQKTKENADMAGRAASLAGTIKGKAETGSKQMDDMMSAVGEINEASRNISKIIKVIDDIAFQTNILALNAAVEAARAGQHGKGFAVVAEEVRNLAAKSAEAAKETGEMIQNSMEKAELGAGIAHETAASLTEIVSGINESDRIVSEIARSSEEQTDGIHEINVAIDQVAKVIHQISASAEESAATSGTMSEQSATLAELIAQFKLRDKRAYYLK